MSRFYGDFDPASTAQTVIATIVTNTSTCALYLPLTTDTNDDSVNNVTVTNSGIVISSAQSQFNGSSAYFSTGNHLSVADGTFNFGTADFTISAYIYHSGVGVAANIFDFRESGDGFTVNMDTSGNIGVYSNKKGDYTIARSNTSIGSGSFKHVAICRDSGTIRLFIDGELKQSTADSFDYGATPVVVGARFTKDQQYFLGYIQDFYVIEGEALFTTAFSAPTVPGATTVSKTRSHSHVWNYSDVYDARFANTWPRLAIPIAWDTTNAGSNVLISNGDLTVTIDGTPSPSWANSAAISVGSHSTGKVYFESTISGSPSSGYLRVGVVQNQGSATLSEIQSGSMGTWDGNAPAYTNKSENRSQANGLQVNDGSNTHSNGDVFMWAFDIDNARAYFGRNGSFDLSFDPVNGTGGYDMSSLSGYNSTDPWHILFQSLRNDQGSVTLRTASDAQYLPTGYSYWGTI